MPLDSIASSSTNFLSPFTWTGYLGPREVLILKARNLVLGSVFLFAVFKIASIAKTVFNALYMSYILPEISFKDALKIRRTLNNWVAKGSTKEGLADRERIKNQIIETCYDIPDHPQYTDSFISGELCIESDLIEDLPDVFSLIPHLKALKISGEKLTTLPPINQLIYLGIFKGFKNSLYDFLKFPNLKFLRISESKLSKIPTTTNFPHELKSLYITKTNITEIPEGISSLPNLEKLNLKDNKINQIHSLRVPKSVSEIDLSKNELTIEGLDIGIFRDFSCFKRTVNLEENPTLHTIKKSGTDPIRNTRHYLSEKHTKAKGVGFSLSFEAWESKKIFIHIQNKTHPDRRSFDARNPSID